MTRASFAVAVGLALGVAACRPASDLNKPCTLLRRNLDGGAPVPITEAEVKAKKNDFKDFIAGGTVECEFLFCVRDSSLVTDAGPNDPAIGYCSSDCFQGTTCPSYDEALDRGPTRLTCRALLLDKEVLSQLYGADAGLGNIREPYFCARGTTADAGL
jgi:hypothetical protein